MVSTLIFILSIIYPFLLQTANPLPMLAGAAMMNVGVDKVRLGVHVFILFLNLCARLTALKRGKQTIELITTTNHCSIIKMFLHSRWLKKIKTCNPSQTSLRRGLMLRRQACWMRMSMMID